MNELEEILGTDIEEGSTAGYGKGGGYSSPVVIDIPAIDEYNKRASQINKEIDQEWIDYKNFQPSNAKPYGYFDSGGQWQEARRSDSGVWMTPEGGFAMPTIYGGPEKPREYMKPISPLTGTESSTWNERKNVSKTHTPKDFASGPKPVDDPVFASLGDGSGTRVGFDKANTAGLLDMSTYLTGAINTDIGAIAGNGTSNQILMYNKQPMQYLDWGANLAQEIADASRNAYNGKWLDENGYKAMAGRLGIDANNPQKLSDFMNAAKPIIENTRNMYDEKESSPHYAYNFTGKKPPFNKENSEFDVVVEYRMDGQRYTERVSLMPSKETGKENSFFAKWNDQNSIRKATIEKLFTKELSSKDTPESRKKQLRSTNFEIMEVRPNRVIEETALRNYQKIALLALKDQDAKSKWNVQYTPQRLNEAEFTVANSISRWLNAYIRGNKK